MELTFGKVSICQMLSQRRVYLVFSHVKANLIKFLDGDGSGNGVRLPAK